MPKSPNYSSPIGRLALIGIVVTIIETAVASVVLYLLASWSGVAPSQALLPYVIVGASVSIMTTFGLFLFYRLRQGTAPLTPSDTRVVQYPTQEAFHRLSEAMVSGLGGTILVSDPQAGVIEARTGPSGRSWGEVLTVRVTPVSATESRVEIQSRPRVAVTIFDSQKNAANVRQLSYSLDSRSAG